jgi:nitrogen regulatory protein P-II 1
VKQIQLIIRAVKLDEIKEALEKEKIRRMTLVDVRSGNGDPGKLKRYRRVPYIEEVSKVKVEIITEDDEAEQVTNTLVGVLRTGALCDGEIAIFPMDKVVRLCVGKV